jgi:hypothetical protein
MTAGGISSIESVFGMGWVLARPLGTVALGVPLHTRSIFGHYDQLCRIFGLVSFSHGPGPDASEDSGNARAGSSSS